MAILNSLLTSKASGSVGEVVLSQLKGQTIMKSKPAKTKKQPSEEQIIQQTKMSNAIGMYKLVKHYIRFCKNVQKPKLSIYNVFVQRLIVELDNSGYKTTEDMWITFEEYNFVDNRSFEINIESLSANSVKISFPAFKGFITKKYKLMFMFVPDYWGQAQIIEHNCTFAELWAGEVILNHSAPVFGVITSAYIYSKDGKFLSTVKWQ